MRKLIRYSTRINKKYQNKFLKDSSFPFLVSFPRTGSHWLRMMMELYFEKPTLVRAFYYKKSKKFLCYHTHDIDQLTKRKNVIYLYRDPCSVVFSQMNYQNENLNDKIRIKYWATIYGLHLEKWLIMENFTGSKTIVNYEKLKNDLEKEFWKICQFFNEELDVSQLNQISQKISKEEVKKKTPHDKKVINRNGNYEQFRRNFIESNHDYIWKNIKKINSNLINFFNE